MCVEFVWRAQVTNGLNDALLRSSAEQACQAVFMWPLHVEAAAGNLTAKIKKGASDGQGVHRALT
jgi:hypothetical protein